MSALPSWRDEENPMKNGWNMVKHRENQPIKNVYVTYVQKEENDWYPHKNWRMSLSMSDLIREDSLLKPTKLAPFWAHHFLAFCLVVVRYENWPAFFTLLETNSLPLKLGALENDFPFGIALDSTGQTCCLVLGRKVCYHHCSWVNGL